MVYRKINFCLVHSELFPSSVDLICLNKEVKIWIVLRNTYKSLFLSLEFGDQVVSINSINAANPFNIHPKQRRKKELWDYFQSAKVLANHFSSFHSFSKIHTYSTRTNCRNNMLQDWHLHLLWELPSGESSANLEKIKAWVLVTRGSITQPLGLGWEGWISEWGQLNDRNLHT